MIVQNRKSSLNVVIYFAQHVLINISKQSNRNAHVVLQSMVKFEVRDSIHEDLLNHSTYLGNQPVTGTMTIDNSKHRLPGFEHDSCGSIRITYFFPNGIQDVSNCICMQREVHLRFKRKVIRIQAHLTMAQLVKHFYLIIMRVAMYLSY